MRPRNCFLLAFPLNLDNRNRSCIGERGQRTNRRAAEFAWQRTNQAAADSGVGSAAAKAGQRQKVRRDARSKNPTKYRSSSAGTKSVCWRPHDATERRRDKRQPIGTADP